MLRAYDGRCRSRLSMLADLESEDKNLKAYVCILLLSPHRVVVFESTLLTACINAASMSSAELALVKLVLPLNWTRTDSSLRLVTLMSDPLVSLNDSVTVPDT